MPSRLFPAFPLLEELRSSLADSPEQLTNSDSEVRGILDLVLSTVGTLRALSDASRSGSRQSTIHFWSLLIRSLAFVCYDKSYAMREAAFVRPRLSYVRNFMEDGHASLLISYIVENIQRLRSFVNDETSGYLSMMTADCSNEESKEESDSETSYDDESSSETSYEHTEASTGLMSAQSSYVPLDTHILASWCHPNSVVLLLLCVTDEEDIFSLIDGVLYQRSTWGISEPVIGIILSKTGFVGRVVLGWLDKVCPNPEVLPAIRFAYGDETRTNGSLGVYDLTDPVNAIKISQLILGLRAHVEEIVAQCQTPTFKRLSWRSDSINDDNSGSEEQWKQRIVNWFNTVAKCKAPSDSSSSHTCSFPMDDSEKRQTRSSSKSRSAGSKNKPPAAESAPQVLPGIGLAQPRKLPLKLRSRRPRLMERPSSLRNVADKRHMLMAALLKLARLVNERRAQVPCLVLRRSSMSIQLNITLSFTYLPRPEYGITAVYIGTTLSYGSVVMSSEVFPSYPVPTSPPQRWSFFASGHFIEQ